MPVSTPMMMMMTINMKMMVMMINMMMNMMMMVVKMNTTIVWRLTLSRSRRRINGTILRAPMASVAHTVWAPNETHTFYPNHGLPFLTSHRALFQKHFQNLDF